MELIAKKELIETSAAHIESSRPEQRMAASCTGSGIDRESDLEVHLRAHYVGKPRHGP
jgi:hypothetical protein